MAETETPADINVSDSELFSSATAPEPKEAPPPHPTEEGRDVHGRFRPQGDQAPKPPGEPPSPPPPGQPTPQPPPGSPTPPASVPPQDDANVPSWRLREEREQRERLAQQLQERDFTLRQMQQRMDEFERQRSPQGQQELPDPLVDPNGYRAAIEGQFNQKLQTMQLESNLQLNRLQHGQIFDEAYQAFMQAAAGDGGFARLIVNSPNPGGSMVNWYKRAVTLARVGDDPEAFINTEIERRLSDPQFLGQALERAKAVASGQPMTNGATPPRANNVVQVPPSLSRVPSGSPTEFATGADGMPSDNELFRSSLPAPRKKA